MKKDTKIYLGLVVIVLVIVVGIFARNYYANKPADEKTMECISSKSMLIASRTCSHCIDQENILGTYLKEFNIVFVDDDSTLWTKYNLIGTPTWVINEKTYPGTKSIKELKDLTNC